MVKGHYFLKQGARTQGVVYPQVVGGFEKFKCGLYPGGRGRYTSIRFLRTLLSIYHTEPMDSEEDWKTLRTMSCHVTAKLTKLNINTYTAALHIRDPTRSALQNGRYSLNELVTFVCLVPE